MIRLQSEHALQKSIISWWSYACRAYGLEPAHLIAVPNGGARNKITGAKLKAEGVRAGCPDLFLAVPRNGSHGLFVEVKTETGRPTQQQKAMQAMLLDQGYESVITYGFKATAKLITDYLEQR